MGLGRHLMESGRLSYRGLYGLLNLIARARGDETGPIAEILT